MSLTIEKLLKAHPQGLKLLSGTPTAVIKEITPPEKAHAHALVFASTKELLQQALHKGFGALCVSEALAKELPSDISAPILVYKDISMAFADLFPLFESKVQITNANDVPVFVDASAKLGANVIVEPFAVIGRNVTIGDNCRIGANSVIEENVRIGHDTIIHAQAFVGHHCEIGHHCNIHPHATIGADGFGFARQPNGEMKKIPQLGKVVIEDNVEIGANCTIDRATMTETRIGHGSKLDKHCHIAHNCQVGPHNVLAAGFWMAGSCKSGAFLTVAGSVVTADHVTITDKVVIAGRSAVTNDITEPGAYGGHPLQPLKQSLKNIANIGRLTEMRKQIQMILKKLNIEGEE